MERQGHLANLPPFSLGDRGGADLLRAVLLVLGDIVEIGAPGDDLHGGEIGVAQHGDLDLPPLDLLLHHHMAAVAQQTAQRLFQLLPGVGQLHADRAAAVDDLHGAGYGQLLRQPGNIGLCIVHIAPRGGADAQRIHKALGNGLVHGHAAAQIAGAGIGYAQQIQRGLDPAILAAAAVQRQKDDVGHPADGQHVLAQHTGALILPAASHSLQIRLHALHMVVGAQAVRRVENILQASLVALESQKHIHQNGLMPLFPQGTADAGTAGQRHLALRGKAAGQNNDLHV